MFKRFVNDKSFCIYHDLGCLWFDISTNMSCFCKVRDELEQLLDDDDDMEDLYLTRKLTADQPSSATGSDPSNWSLNSPNLSSKLCRTSRESPVTAHDENDVEELEMLLEVKLLLMALNFKFKPNLISVLIYRYLQAYFMQIDGTLNKLATVSSRIIKMEN